MISIKMYTNYCNQLVSSGKYFLLEMKPNYYYFKLFDADPFTYPVIKGLVPVIKK